MSLDIVTFKSAPIEIIDGDRGKNYPKQDEFTDEGYCLFLNAKNVTENGFNFDTKMFISKERDNLLKKGKLQKGDVILTTRGTVGNVAFYSKHVPFDNIRINSGMLILRSKQELDSEFLYWTLKSNYFQKQIYTFQSGTAQPQLPISSLNHMEFYLPSFDIQKKIVKILSQIDEKIRLSQEINKYLDKIIRTLYNSWFVNFLPFQNTDFKDTYMGEIPFNWEIKNLNEVCDKISDSYKPDSDEVVLLQTSDISKGKVLNHEKVPNDDYKGHFKYKFEKNDILYTQIRPKNERYAFINFNPINYVASTQLMVLRAKKDIILPYILYLFLTSPDMIKEVNLLAESRSGTFPQINFNEIKHEKVIVAPLEVYEKFWNLIECFVEKKFIIDDEIDKLQKLRDTLLPKLMSGEIDVSQINCDLE